MLSYLRGCLAMALLLPTFCVAGTLAEGWVFLDSNANGVRDRGEPGVADVKLSNGRDIIVTDANGRYEIALQDGDTLFVIKPPGHRFALGDDGLPMFWKHHFPSGSERLKYGQIAPVNADKTNFALLPNPVETAAAFDVLLIADSQVTNALELEYYRRAIIEPARRHAGVVLGVTLGDLVNDALDLYPDLNRINAALGIPWLHAPGNHDIDFDANNDVDSSINYRRHFGPDTVAFEMPGHAFISLDDVIYLPDARPPFIGGLREDQLKFLENYLATLRSNTRVVMSFHIPLFDDRGETFRHADRARLFGLLERFSEPLILSGHTHTQRHHFHGPESGWHGAVPLHEYNVGAACGGFWSGLMGEDGLPDTRMSDGSPNGYAVVTFAPDHYRTRYFASRARDDLRIGLTSPGVLRRGAYPSHPVYANAYAAEPDAQVDYRIDDGNWQPMQRVLEPDPELSAINADDRRAARLRSFDRAVPARVSHHLWTGRVPTNLPVGEHRIEVRVQSRYEGEFRATTSYHLEDWSS